MCAKKGIFSFYFHTNLLYRILFALVLGSCLGMFIDKNDTLINFISLFGDLFIRLLKMIMVPIITFSLIIGTSSISPARLGKVGLKSILFYFFTSLCAIIIGLGCGLVFNTGGGLRTI
ncbi:cation:dicarboxylate symporter family transporter [Campylobacter sp. MG1]|uniref:cation:dicarboxylate symporter family transporter n=1 Tax=Campylobacter sp. MG1 TaxID=2976332 RepID=UPI00226CB5FC|nr:cation:dicarboxylase symporter family transporter [Campylobacter sp. MG1]